MKPIYEAPTAIDLAPDLANQSDINCVKCTNGANNESACAAGAGFYKPSCTAGVSAGPICLSGSAQQW
jgi:hypothetical protein